MSDICSICVSPKHLYSRIQVGYALSIFCLFSFVCEGPYLLRRSSIKCVRHIFRISGSSRHSSPERSAEHSLLFFEAVNIFASMAGLPDVGRDVNKMARLTFEPAIAFSFIIANARINVKSNYFLLLLISLSIMVFSSFLMFSRLFSCQYLLFFNFLEYVYFFCNRIYSIFPRIRTYYWHLAVA